MADTLEHIKDVRKAIRKAECCSKNKASEVIKLEAYGYADDYDKAVFQMRILLFIAKRLRRYLSLKYTNENNPYLCNCENGRASVPDPVICLTEDQVNCIIEKINKIC